VSGAVQVVVAVGAVVAGVVVAVRPGPVAAFLLDGRAGAQRHGSLLNPERTARTIDSFNNARSRRLEVWFVRGLGAFLVAGGVFALAS
jgi:hypothetical protein